MFGHHQYLFLHSLVSALFLFAVNLGSGWLEGERLTQLRSRSPRRHRDLRTVSLYYQSLLRVTLECRLKGPERPFFGGNIPFVSPAKNMGFLFSRPQYDPCRDIPDLTGKVALVTGAKYAPIMDQSTFYALTDII